MMQFSAEVCDRLDYFDYDVVGFPFFDGGVPRHPSCGVHVSQLFCIARAYLRVGGLDNRQTFLTAKLIKQSYRYHTPQSIIRILS